MCVCVRACVSTLHCWPEALVLFTEPCNDGEKKPLWPPSLLALLRLLVLHPLRCSVSEENKKIHTPCSFKALNNYNKSVQLHKNVPIKKSINQTLNYLTSERERVCVCVCVCVCTSMLLTRPSWKEQSCRLLVQTCRYLHQWHGNMLLTHDVHLTDREQGSSLTAVAGGCRHKRVWWLKEQWHCF